MTEEEDFIKTLILFGFREINTTERRMLSRIDYNQVIEYYNGTIWRFFIR